ncbi:YdeI/OmpD-associated family protein [Clostridium grantii]|uniref:Bacteriocin-protection, YdeI or OmpD-Associated n=1 Tax=Clostridium grantii DSM 8605 TaxID=1121316 RepID=A0A1M5WQA1_9CLOT|nr:YdeI/OmpD-associated family protein [Clostridium grantii]SHH89776.1 Bacteriocin-protection, YdeI or OmpD-Associated [Clostridium grantii DSM 8605]
MTFIQFESTLSKINDWLIFRIPESCSAKFSSRGMVMIEGTINGVDFHTELEPDGAGSHWFRVSDNLWEKANLKLGVIAKISIKPLELWPEPELPVDLKNALKLCKLENQWDTITTKAHWEWIRWIRSTHNPQTSEKRIKTLCSMVASGKKRPCCFDHSRCTITEVSKNGVLL